MQHTRSICVAHLTCIEYTCSMYAHGGVYSPTEMTQHPTCVARMHLRTHARMHACMHARTHACTLTHTHTRARARARRHARMHGRTHAPCMHGRTHAPCMHGRTRVLMLRTEITLRLCQALRKRCIALPTCVHHLSQHPSQHPCSVLP